jgi:protein arginine kinase activator
LKCQECQQHQATIHFTKIINGEKTEMHLCESCAKDKDGFFGSPSSYSMNSLLSGLLNFDYSLQGAASHNVDQKQVECDFCGLTYEMFSKTGLFGCASCYKTFSNKLEPIIKRVHSGNTTHGGKIPKRIGGHIHLQKEMKKLKEDLRECIENEEFEKAAVVRDELKALEKKIEEGR